MRPDSFWDFGALKVIYLLTYLYTLCVDMNKRSSIFIVFVFETFNTVLFKH